MRALLKYEEFILQNRKEPMYSIKIISIRLCLRGTVALRAGV
jgi:hypothetical protein